MSRLSLFSPFQVNAILLPSGEKEGLRSIPGKLVMGTVSIGGNEGSPEKGRQYIQARAIAITASTLAVVMRYRGRWILLQAAAHDALDRRRDSAGKLRRVLLQDRAHRVDGGITLEHPPARQH